ncbi:uncharacterized protein LOC135488549 [Lineus longissimus]|uniref:uncharacterized protein LOC135488549 n=1 Tax=Lineus longissimus TaxID=88925 RepID=UPI00315C9923
MDTAVGELTELLRQGLISQVTYAEGLRALRARPVAAPKREEHVPAPPERPIQASEADVSKYIRTPFAVGNYLRGWVIEVGDKGGIDPSQFMRAVKGATKRKISEEILDLNGVKFQLAANVRMLKERNNGEDIEATPTFYSDQQSALRATDIDEGLDKAQEKISRGIENFMRDGSGWGVDRVIKFYLNIARYQPLRWGSYIDLPVHVKRKKAVVNVKNKDDHCLRWALLSAKYPAADHSDRISRYLPFRDTLDFRGVDSPTPLSQVGTVEAKNDLAINVFGYDNGVYPLRVSEAPAYLQRTNLLLVEKGERQHYTWIKDLDRLLHDQSKHKERKHFCERCLHCFTRSDLLEGHKPDCKGIDGRPMRTRMPAEDQKMLRFVNHHKQLKAPYIIYADFEALTTKIEGAEFDPAKSNTQKTQHHETCGFGYVVVRCDGHTEAPVVYRGLDAAKRFLECLGEEEARIKVALSRPAPMEMATDDVTSHQAAQDCHVCGKLLDGDSVRDHCHITGKYRGAAHNACNLKLRLSAKKTHIPVVFHNLRGYDSHLIMQAISQDEGQVACIPNNMEKYISFSLRSLRFIDSAQFLLASLDRLVSACPREAFVITRTFQPNNTDLLMRKGIYPYEYMSSWDKFQEAELPPIEAFFRSERGRLNGQQEVCQGQQSVEGYDPGKPKSHLMYLDANNLYGWGMSQPLATGGFEWVDPILEEEIINHPNDAEKGYILEVDLEYPEELHDSHSAYPLAPERLRVKDEWLSEYQNDLLKEIGGSLETEKLVPNLRDKQRYVVHYRNLKLYLGLGMRLKKIHRALRFDQRAWMEPYIMLNTDLRRRATNDFDKDLYKLMNNSVFGKTMENVRKRVDVKLVRASEEDKLRRLIAKPNYARSKIFDDNLAALHMHETNLYLNRPIYVGMFILDLSKLLMYDFYYNQIKVKYGSGANLLYTDTDSLLMQIETEDIYADMAGESDLYDTCDYPPENPLYSTKNKKVIGKTKDECAGVPVAEFVGLRPKMYSIRRADAKEIRKAKGVKKNVVKQEIRHEQYKECLFEKKVFHHGMNALRSEGHHIYGLRINKVSLSPMDTKRWIAEDGIHTLAYGHKDAIPAGSDEMDAYIDELLAGMSDPRVMDEYVEQLLAEL